jgi:hypothetical protein
LNAINSEKNDAPEGGSAPGMEKLEIKRNVNAPAWQAYIQDFINKWPVLGSCAALLLIIGRYVFISLRNDMPRY